MSSNFLFVLLAISIEHMVLIVLAILLLFGGKKIPELMRGLGKGIREFNDAKDNVKKEIENAANEPPKRAETSNATTSTTSTT
ncbi:MAG: twin-arginine translocase TatA/TatE family subunit [Chitinophagaceae bacterium]|jgi:sec-independent protein translocase protein TatA|nr:twin-arginine translocase TatA/TatE family subunit [Chitinophagaceae bacterium]